MTGLHGSGVIGDLRHENWWYRGDSSFLIGQKSFMRTRMKGLLIMLQWQMSWPLAAKSRVEELKI